MPTEFYFKIQYFNFEWKNTITPLLSHRNTQQWQVRLRSVLFRGRISNSSLFPFNSCFNIVHSLNVLQFNHKTCDGRGRALTTGTGCLSHLRVLLYFAKISGPAEGVKRITKTCNLRLFLSYLTVCSVQEKWTQVWLTNDDYFTLRRTILT